MKYAIEHSQHLGNDVNFYKITGRLFIPEFDKIQYRYADYPNVFQITYNVDQNSVSLDRATQLKLKINNFKLNLKMFLISPRTRGLKGPHNPNVFVQTYFYKSNVAFFKKNFINSYKRTYEWWDYRLENAYYDDVIGKNFTVLKKEFRTIGRSGTSGQVISGDYTDDIKDLAKTFM